MGSTLLALGHYAPERRVPNSEIEARLGLEPGWIEGRTGIRGRRFAAPDEALSDMAVRAGEMALERAGFDRGRVALLVLATSTPDHLLPPSAPLVAHRLGITGAGAIDMAGACAGFLYALAFADTFVRTQGSPALVIAANILSRRTNSDDRSTAILFADAAGAALLAPCDRPGTGVLGLHLSSEGGGYDLIKIESGGSRRPFASNLSEAELLMRMTDGRAVFAKAVDLMAEASLKALARAGLAAADIDHFVPHQANVRMMAAIQKKLAIGGDKLISTVALYANSSAATIPFSLSLAAATRDYKAGDRILMCAAGAGLTAGAVAYGL
jgi:3-oxoacyl-[acyl-carrier-protein] synthase-3